MRKIYVKLASSLVAVLMALTMVAGVSYAWLTLSNSPAVNGIQVAIGGGNTILLAADICQTVQDEYGNDVVIHYPGSFDETLNLSQYHTYDYLAELSGLSPVSTADGVNWLLPVYDEQTGALQPVEEFTVDSRLAYANNDSETTGGYAYVDFWVVSPGSDYDLHVAIDTKTGEGSFLIELPETEETEDGFHLRETSGRVASTARVGFLANTMVGDSAAMDTYSSSDEYDSRFKKLLGQYQEPGELPMVDSSVQNFTVYEPNALLHPWDSERNGAYVVTRPLGYDEMTGTVAETDFARVMVQENNTWRYDGEVLWLEEIFQASVANAHGDLNAEEAAANFYGTYLGGQVAAYVSAGSFFANTGVLYDFAATNEGIVAAETVNTSLSRAGATEDVAIISLTRNTPQRIRMFIWLEGQDADCANIEAMAAVSFALGVELSGETK